jgi:enamine deaminase RidA (YjgF/YER057c/UK114 family)
MKSSLFFFLLFLSGFDLWAQSDPESKLKELGISLPVMSKPVANYVKYVQTGKLIYLSGHGPKNSKGEDIAGKVGEGTTVEQGYEAARACAIQLISTLKDATGGDLKKVKRIVKILGMVNCTPGFTDQPKVMNGCSDLLVAVFGENGKHARSAIGMNALPNNIVVEIEMIVEVE